MLLNEAVPARNVTVPVIKYLIDFLSIADIIDRHGRICTNQRRKVAHITTIHYDEKKP